MKNLKHLLILGLILHAGYSSAQAIPEEGRQTVDDILFLADVFAAPAASSAAYQATAGWFTSARALEEWKVDISLHGNALFVPKSKQEFSLNNSDFNVLRIGGGSNGALIPTAFGKRAMSITRGISMEMIFSLMRSMGLIRKLSFIRFRKYHWDCLMELKWL